MGKISWYKISEMIGLDPFGEGVLTNKVRVSPYGHAGGEAYTGILEPSDSKTHANDYFGGDKGEGITEKKLKKIRKKKKKIPIKKFFMEKNTAQKDVLEKIGQWGTGGPSIPTWDSGGKDWVSETFQKVMPKEDKDSSPQPIGNKESIDIVLQSTVTINSFSNNQSEIGSGFFINNNTILTCAHVALPNFSTENVSMKVKFGDKQLNATLWAYDISLDIAAIIINDPNFSVNKYLKLANSLEINPGDSILTIGTPLGFENVVQQGIVSSTPQDYMEQGKSKKYIFISTSISPGNSGGPVTETVNNSVVGVAAAVISSADVQSQGLNAAIPIDIVKNFLKKNGIKFEFQKLEKKNE